jgi:hypothetical protein
MKHILLQKAKVGLLLINSIAAGDASFDIYILQFT